MPTLQELLNDPNYTGANAATKAAIFEKYAANDKNYAGANDATKAAIRQKFGVEKAQSVEERAPAASSEPVPEIREDTTPQWKKTLADYFNPPVVGETIGTVVGGLAGLPLAPESLGLSMVAGAGLGAGIGRQGGALVSKALGLPEREGYDDVAPAILRGAAAEMGGQALSAAGGAIARKFPTPSVRAGELLVESKKTLPPGTPQAEAESRAVAERGAELAGAMSRAGVKRLPETVDPNIRRQAMAGSRASASDKVRASEIQLDVAAREQAGKALDVAIPATTPERIALVRKELTDYEARQVAAAEAANLKAKETYASAAAQQATRRATEALAEVEQAIPKTSADPQELGRQLLGRLRGDPVGSEAEKTGMKKVKDVFSRYYNRYDTMGVASPTDELATALAEAEARSVESGRVLRNYLAEAGVVERRLTSLVDDGSGGVAAAIPETFSLGQWRGLKGELAEAATREGKAGNYAAEAALRDLASVAKNGEMAAAAQLPADELAGYIELSQAYKNVYVEGFRRGRVGATLKPGGKALGGETIEAGKVFSAFKNVDAADSLMTALGAEKAAAAGAVLKQTPAMLRRMGAEEAKKIVQPFFEQEIAFIYRQYGGGADGTKAVLRYLRSNQRILEKYGLDFDPLKAAAKNYTEAGARLSGVQTEAMERVVADTLGRGGKPLTDPYKVADYVLKADNPTAAYQKLASVSNTAEWKGSIDGLIKEQLKKKVGAGTDIFADQKIAEVLPNIYSAAQLQTLKDYQTIVRQLATKNPQTAFGKDVGGGVAEAFEQALSVTPVGYGALYAVKQLLRIGAKGEAAGYTKAVASYLDDALVDPAKAELLIEAYKGSARGRAALGEAIKKEHQAMTKLGMLNRAAISLTEQGAAALSGGPEKEAAFGD